MAAAVAVAWILLWYVTGSFIGAVIVLVIFAAAAGVGLAGLRALGVTRSHPVVQQLSARPWRDGQDVLQLALRHLREIYVIMPSGALVAPNSVEIQLSEEDVASLSERMDLGLICENAAEVYVEQVAAAGARLADPGPAQLRIVAEPSVPSGRYRLRQGQPVRAGSPIGYPVAAGSGLGPDPSGLNQGRELAGAAAPRGGGAASYAGYGISDGGTRPQPGRSTASPVMASSTPTVAEQSGPRIPELRLVTGTRVSATTTSGARAGRGAVELGLPHVPTVSREHARFTYSSGQWWIANLGRNGLKVNGEAVAGERPIKDGDAIRWGTRSDAILSRVEIAS